MTRRDENFYERFPSAIPQQPITTHTQNKSNEQSIPELYNLLAGALPYLKEYASFEPYAKPIRIEHGWNSGLTCGWEFYKTEQSPFTRQPGRTTYYMLTEGGLVGTTGGLKVVGEPVYFMDKARRLGERSLKQLLNTREPNTRTIACQFESVLLNTGHQVDLQRLVG